MKKAHLKTRDPRNGGTLTYEVDVVDEEPADRDLEYVAESIADKAFRQHLVKRVRVYFYEEGEPSAPIGHVVLNREDWDSAGRTHAQRWRFRHGADE